MSSHKSKTFSDFAKRISSLGLRTRSPAPAASPAELELTSSSADASNASTHSEYDDDDDDVDHEPLPAIFRFVGLLGAGAHGVVVLSSNRALEPVVATADGMILFPGEHATLTTHAAAAQLEYTLRNQGSSDAANEQLDQEPLYLAIKRVNVAMLSAPPAVAAPAVVDHRTTPISLAQLHGLPPHMLQRRSSESGDAAVLSRFTDEACDAVPITRRLAASLPTSTSTEIAAMTRLKHPNIVRLYNVFLSADVGNLYLCTELVSGGDLATAIAKLQIPKDVVKRERYARRTVGAICSALAYMHSRNITHRDLKPGNVLVGPPVKVCDLGLSGDNAVMRTKLGTADYMAPEIVLADGTQPYGATIDCWSLGVMTYELVSKEHDRPFIGRNQSMLMQSILRHETTLPPYIDQLLLPNYAVSDDCVAFIRALLCSAATRSTAAAALEHPWLTTPEAADRPTPSPVPSSDGDRRYSRRRSSMSTAASDSSLGVSGSALSASDSASSVTSALSVSGRAERKLSPVVPKKKKKPRNLKSIAEE